MLKDLLVTKVYAVPTTPIDTGVFGSGDLTVSGLITWIVNLVIIVGFGLVLVFLAIGFVKFITSQGDKVATESAQKSISYAVIGGVGLFAVYAIKSIILNILGVDDPLKNVE